MATDLISFKRGHTVYGNNNEIPPFRIYFTLSLYTLEKADKQGLTQVGSFLCNYSFITAVITISPCFHLVLILLRSHVPLKVLNSI